MARWKIHVLDRIIISSLILNRLKAGDVSLDEEQNQLNVDRRRSPEAWRAATISFTLKDRNISIAICIFCSCDTPVHFSAANLAKLQEKHPPAHSGAQWPPNPADKPALQVSEEAAHPGHQVFPCRFCGESWWNKTSTPCWTQLNVGKCEVISMTPFNPEGTLAGYIPVDRIPSRSYSH